MDFLDSEHLRSWWARKLSRLLFLFENEDGSLNLKAVNDELIGFEDLLLFFLNNEQDREHLSLLTQFINPVTDEEEVKDIFKKSLGRGELPFSNEVSKEMENKIIDNILTGISNRIFEQPLIGQELNELYLKAKNKLDYYLRNIPSDSNTFLNFYSWYDLDDLEIEILNYFLVKFRSYAIFSLTLHEEKFIDSKQVLQSPNFKYISYIIQANEEAIENKLKTNAKLISNSILIKEKSFLNLDWEKLSLNPKYDDYFFDGMTSYRFKNHKNPLETKDGKKYYSPKSQLKHYINCRRYGGDVGANVYLS